MSYNVLRTELQKSAASYSVPYHIIDVELDHPNSRRLIVHETQHSVLNSLFELSGRDMQVSLRINGYRQHSSTMNLGSGLNEGLVEHLTCDFILNSSTKAAADVREKMIRLANKKDVGHSSQEGLQIVLKQFLDPLEQG